MSSTFISNIKVLVNTREENQLLRGKALAQLPCIENAYLVVTDGRIAEFGKMAEICESRANGYFRDRAPV